MNRIPAWTARASCSGDLRVEWVAHPRKIPPATRSELAALCRDCPVILECNKWAAGDPSFTGWAAARGWERHR